MAQILLTLLPYGLRLLSVSSHSGGTCDAAVAKPPGGHTREQLTMDSKELRFARSSSASKTRGHKKKKEIPVALPLTSDDVQRELEALRREVKELKKRTSTTSLRAPDPTRCLRDEDITIGLQCAVKIAAGRYAPVEVVDQAIFEEAEERIYQLKRLDRKADGGQARAVRPQYARELFPLSAVTTPWDQAVDED